MVFVAQVKVTDGAEVTVNVALQVTFDWHILVTVQVTVLVPPHLGGPSVPPSLLMDAIQPPINVADASHDA